nr:cilia- and flagella-associated protein 53-like [Leptinotarsa decemlineata]
MYLKLRLREMLCTEEQGYYYETTDKSQKMDEMKMKEMKERVDLLKRQREEERLKIVQQKRIEQYRDRCQELRPSLIKKHLIETKNCQLQQIRDNEARREAERELDKMWHDLSFKEMQAKTDREQQEVIGRKQNQQDLQNIWEKQIRGKELLKAEEEKVAQEDRLEMQKLREQLRREEIEGLDSKRRKRDKTAKELLEQIANQEQLLAKRKQEEDSVDQAFTKLAEIEIEREKQAVQDFTIQYRREAALYRKHLQELEEERKKEEKELNELLNIHRKEIERKQDEAKCKLAEAKMKLQKDVLQGRAEQLVHKRQEAENQLKLKQAENELLRMAFEMNERLQAESDRLEAEAVRQYREDLQKQIEHNNVLRERERQELERQLEEGRKEEEMYNKIVQDMIKENVQNDMKHPFRRVLENYDCRCISNKPL